MATPHIEAEKGAFADILRKANLGHVQRDGNALRFAASFPKMAMVLSGMSDMEQMQDNIAALNSYEAFHNWNTSYYYNSILTVNGHGKVSDLYCWCHL